LYGLPDAAHHIMGCQGVPRGAAIGWRGGMGPRVPYGGVGAWGHPVPCHSAPHHRGVSKSESERVFIYARADPHYSHRQGSDFSLINEGFNCVWTTRHGKQYLPGPTTSYGESLAIALTKLMAPHPLPRITTFLRPVPAAYGRGRRYRHVFHCILAASFLPSIRHINGIRGTRAESLPWCASRFSRSACPSVPGGQRWRRAWCERRRPEAPCWTFWRVERSR